MSSGHLRARPALSTLVLVLALLGSPSSSLGRDVEVPEPLRRLERLLGSWETDRVELLDENGEVIRVSAAEARNRRHLDGLVIAHAGRLLDPEIEVRGWYYWDRDDERLHLATVSSGGRHDEFVGGWEGDRLVLVTEPRPADEGRLFKLIYGQITEDSFVESLEISDDGGGSWRVSSRQTMYRAETRAPAGRPPALERLGDYVGHWRAEDRVDPQGDPFHFELEQRWLDPQRTILAVTISRISAEGSTLIFQGYKGMEPTGDGVYYFAASPSGRAARGEVVVDGEDLVFVYDGWEAFGQVVEIRDVFTPLTEEGRAFLSRTFLRPDPGSEWRQVGEEHWRRMADRGD